MRNQILITLDSLRWDVFKAAKLPTMKSQQYGPAWSHATYTLPAHTSFFMGKMPHSFDGNFCDWAARSNNREIAGIPLWRITSPESPGPGDLKLTGKNLIHGFKSAGYATIGTGGVNWFNTGHQSHISQLEDFEYFKWFGPYTHGPEQLEWSLRVARTVSPNQAFFMFINFGETHHRFQNADHMTPTDYGNARKCFEAQVRSVEFLDKLVDKLINDDSIGKADILICGDHGECFGEDGLWGHGFYHPKVMEVPLAIIRT